MSELQAPASLPPVTADAPPTAPRSDAAASPDFTGITPPRRRGGAARFITDVIVELGFVPKEKVDNAVEQGRATQQSPEKVLLDSGVLGADELARATAERFGLDHVDLTVYKPDIAAVNLLGASSAKRYNAIPIGFHNSGNLLVAMSGL
jgi:type IV pilus assembly protein PilB